MHVCWENGRQRVTGALLHAHCTATRLHVGVKPTTVATHFTMWGKSAFHASAASLLVIDRPKISELCPHLFESYVLLFHTVFRTRIYSQVDRSGLVSAYCSRDSTCKHYENPY